MPNVTFMIGNGFDLQIGLKTRFTDFYKSYCVTKNNDSKLIAKFKNEILKDEAQGWKNWSDFELGMGKQAREFSSSEDFLVCFDDFVVNFMEYLDNECDSIDWDNVDQIIKKEFRQSIVGFNNIIKSVSQNTFNQVLAGISGSSTNYDFIEFNYTNVFDKLLQSVKESVIGSTKIRILNCLHIHGELNNYPVMGVDSDEQIAYESNSKEAFTKSIKTVFVKPLFLEKLQKRNVNAQIPAKKAFTIIGNSDIICVFGASMGQTDKTWWKAVGDWLKTKNRFLFIFDVCGENDDGISPLLFLSRENKISVKREDIFDRVATLAEWSDDVKEEIREKVVIELDNTMFNFKLPRKT